jgi:hypothetical protein
MGLQANQSNERHTRELIGDPACFDPPRYSCKCEYLLHTDPRTATALNLVLDHAFSTPRQRSVHKTPRIKKSEFSLMESSSLHSNSSSARRVSYGLSLATSGTGATRKETQLGVGASDTLSPDQPYFRAPHCTQRAGAAQGRNLLCAPPSLTLFQFHSLMRESHHFGTRKGRIIDP